MSPCLSDTALTRVMAELGTADERAHLATCVACTARYQEVTRDVDVIRRVLAATPELPARELPRTHRWVPIVAALSVVAVAALLWIEVAVWRAVQSASPVPEPIALALADVSAALFSVSGEPARVLAQSPLQELTQDHEVDTACEGPGWLEESRCQDALDALEGPELMDSTTLDNGDNPDQGGHP
jgi:hypothetical protein